MVRFILDFLAYSIFFLGQHLDYFRSVSSADHNEASDVDRGIKILANAHRRLAGGILQLKFEF